MLAASKNLKVRYMKGNNFLGKNLWAPDKIFKLHFCLLPEIIRLVKLGYDEVNGVPLRPSIHHLRDCEMAEDYVIQCITDCWDELPENRPDFGMIRARLKKMKDGKYVDHYIIIIYNIFLMCPILLI